MQDCALVNELRRLKRSSIESIDNANEQRASNVYFHVERQIEEELRKLLRIVNAEGNKALVLLCGSAGDGKSHLISYLRYDDKHEEHLLDDYQVINDATESTAPNKTSITTLAEKLRDYDDDHFMCNDGKRTILAINLGTLSNFIESEEAANYTQLKEYVDRSNIISGFYVKNEYDKKSVFQHISFSDYHIFELTKNRPTYEYLDALIEKVVKKQEGNQFYAAYEKCKDCAYHAKCPVRDNFEFMQDDICQDAIEYCLLQIEFHDKIILSTRDILDFVYSAIVPPDFETNISKLNATVDAVLMEQYIKWTTPMLLFDQNGSSPILDMVGKYDPLKKRSREMDKNAIRVHSLDDITDTFQNATDRTPYGHLNLQTNFSVEGAKSDLKQLIFNFIVRTCYVKDNVVHNADGELIQYLRYLYYQNSNQEFSLKDLYDMTINAVMHWNGRVEDANICIDNTGDKYLILERLELQGNYQKDNGREKLDALVRYSPTLDIRIKKKGTNESESLDMDFSLFQLMLHMDEGYYPSAHDKNTHTDFNSFVQRLCNKGDKSSRIIIKDRDDGINWVFEHNGFSYEFKAEK